MAQGKSDQIGPLESPAAFIDYDAPMDYQNRIDDEMDHEGYVHFRDQPGLDQDLKRDYNEANLV